MRCGALQTHRHAPAFASAALKQRNSRNDMSTPHRGATSVRIGEGFRSKLPYFLFFFFRDLPFVASLFVWMIYSNAQRNRTHTQDTAPNWFVFFIPSLFFLSFLPSFFVFVLVTFDCVALCLWWIVADVWSATRRIDPFLLFSLPTPRQFQIDDLLLRIKRVWLFGCLGLVVLFFSFLPTNPIVSLPIASITSPMCHFTCRCFFCFLTFFFYLYVFSLGGWVTH